MALEFSHTTLGQRVLFGAGEAASHLAKEVDRLGAQRVMVIASDSAKEHVGEITQQIDVALNYNDVVMHVPIETAEKARTAAAENTIDLVVCIGGGSATGLAKAIALTTGIPIIAIPTTYSGSEGTNVWGLTEAARKTTGSDDRVLPATVIYDSDLTLSLPVELSVASGLNGMAHCIDALWGPRADPINAALAAEGIRALAEGLSKIVDNPQGTHGRDQALYGAYLAAVSFASAGSGLHHKICHVLGGTFNLPHAQTHATVLPYVLAFNAADAPEAEQRIAVAFGTATALEGLQNLRTKLDAPKALQDLGFTADGIPEAVEVTLPAIPANNPREVTSQNLTQLLQGALTGDDPAVLIQESVRS